LFSENKITFALLIEKMNEMDEDPCHKKFKVKTTL
jgi:hypothetical protein